MELLTKSHLFFFVLCATCRPTPSLADQGWTTTWTYAGGEGTTDDCIAQSGITHDGDMALEMASSGAIEIGFPSVSSGILTKR